MSRTLSRHLRIESLEGRRLMTVTANAIGSHLSIQGDAGADHIQVAPSLIGGLTISSLNGTKINGRSAIHIPKIISSIDVNMRRGDDRVDFINVDLADFNVKMGAGADVVRFIDVNGPNQNAKVDLGAGNDRNIVINAAFQTYKVDGRNGVDRFRLQNSVFDYVEVSGQKKDDFLTFRGRVAAGTVVLTGGRGTNVVRNIDRLGADTVFNNWP